jgi:hypothetical protein
MLRLTLTPATNTVTLGTTDDVYQTRSLIHQGILRFLLITFYFSFRAHITDCYYLPSKNLGKFFCNSRVHCIAKLPLNFWAKLT